MIERTFWVFPIAEIHTRWQAPSGRFLKFYDEGGVYWALTLGSNTEPGPRKQAQPFTICPRELEQCHPESSNAPH